MIYSVQAKNGLILFEVVRKRVKNIILHVKSDGSVVVSANRNVSTEKIKAFVLKNEAFIASAKQKAEQRNPKATTEYEDGATVFLWGKRCILSVHTGRKGVQIDGDTVFLSVPDKSDTTVRQTVMRDFYKKECERVISQLCREAMPLFGRTVFPMLSFRRMTSRWGSCRAKANRLSFNISLATVGVDVTRYVVYHEFAHFLQQNHSVKFYQELVRRMPEWKKYRTILKREGRFV